MKGTSRGLIGLIIVISLALIGCSSGQTATENQGNQAAQQATGQVAQGGYLPLTVVEARRLIDNDQTIQIIDVREPDEFAGGHIKGAKLIPLGQLASRMGEIDKTKPVLVYCLSGVRSKQAAYVLGKSGYIKVYNLRRGIDHWPYPLVK